VGAQVAGAGLGCNWYDDDRCQINLGKKVAAAASNASFTWFSFPKCVGGSKWKVVTPGRSVHAYCLIDELTTKLAPACHASCGQPIPSMGHYSLCFFNCFFQQLLGGGWNNGTSGTAGVSAASLQPAFALAFARCPDATGASIGKSVGRLIYAAISGPFY
jgi:hypothetical protein